MIVVNKFELYRQYACKIFWNNSISTITNTVIVNRFNYDFTINNIGAGQFSITNTQQFFTSDKTNLFCQQILYATFDATLNFKVFLVDSNTMWFFVKDPTAIVNYSGTFSAYLTLQVYF